MHPVKSLVTILILGATIALTGCALKEGPVWWNPTTWGSRVAPARVDRAEEKRDEAKEQKEKAEKAVVDAAHREDVKTGKALAAAPDSKPVRLARRFNANSLALMAQVRPLTAEESMQLRNLVSDLLSDNEQTARNAELQQVRDEAKSANISRELTAATEKLARKDEALAKANANLREAYDRENALANQVRNFWFIVGFLALLWIAGNVLPVLARFIPALAPVATAANLVAAPAMAFAEQRARAGLRKIGEGMARVRKELPTVAERVTDIFDQAADHDHKLVIGAAADAAANSPRT